MLPRIVLLTLTAVFGFLGPRDTHTVARSAARDDGLIRAAALRLAHSSPVAVTRWLGEKRGVRAAALGLDGETVNVEFRDGGKAAILPRAMSRASLAPGLRSLGPRSQHDQVSAGGRALILEPFASELGLGLHAADLIANDLTASGFQVDQLYDQNVTMATMQTLPRYNVLYWHTHTGVNQYGEAVIATGQLADDQSTPKVSDDGTTMTVGVEGDSKLYDGILSQYVAQKLGAFPAHSLWFVNGCDMLDGTLFWQALNTKGVAAMVSWDNWTLPKDGQIAGDLFFADAQNGMSVSSAVANIKAQGYGTSTAAGHDTSHLGYRGDGDLTLQQVLPPTPTPFPATATPTATPVPTATPAATPVPLTTSLRGTVAAGSRQTVTVHWRPGAVVQFRVEYPNGDHQSARTVANEEGTVAYSYTQGSSKIRHNAFTARVLIKGTLNSDTARATRSYRIQYGSIDVSVEPREQSSGKMISVWIHSSPRTAVVVALLPSGSRAPAMTNQQGWALLKLRVSAGLSGKVLVQAAARVSGRWQVTKSSFTVG